MLRRLRISVRAAMIFVLRCAWLGWITHRAREQHEAVAAVRRAGGHVVYNGDNLRSGASDLIGHFRPRWLVNLIGPDYLCKVTDVSLDRNATDANLIQIGRLRRLGYLEYQQFADLGRGIGRAWRSDGDAEVVPPRHADFCARGWRTWAAWLAYNSLPWSTPR